MFSEEYRRRLPAQCARRTATRGRQLAALVRSLDQTRPITLGGGATAGASDPSWQYVDVGDVHYNANGNGYGPIHAAHPGSAMTHSEDWPATVYDDWAFVQANDWAVGKLGLDGVGLPRRIRNRQDAGRARRDLRDDRKPDRQSGLDQRPQSVLQLRQRVPVVPVQLR